MSKRYAACVVLVSALFAPLLQGAAPQLPLGEIVGDDVYTNCEYRVAAQFPGEPKFRDITYRDGARTAPARQFYFNRPIGPLSVTVVHFADGPALDRQALVNAAENLRRRGQVRFDFPVYYDDAIAAQIPGRQLQIGLKNGHLLNGSVYMADHRLYITEAIADREDFPALLFSQSVSLIDEHGTDLDTNPVTLNPDAPEPAQGFRRANTIARA